MNNVAKVSPTSISVLVCLKFVYTLALNDNRVHLSNFTRYIYNIKISNLSRIYRLQLTHANQNKINRQGQLYILKIAPIKSHVAL